MGENRLKVLLIEDDEDDYILTRELLEEIGGERFVLDWKQNYDSGLEAARKNTYDVCLLDYRLGPQTGLDLLREARAGGCSIPMILLTGQGDLEIDIEAMTAGAADYLIKGEINSSMLERSIRYAVAQRRIAEERVQHIREQEARAQAEAANRAKDEFLATVSHELRTPLNAMLGWIQLLRLHKGDEETFNRAVETIERNIKLQTKFVEDLLDITRIVQGNLRLEKRKVILSGIVSSAIDAIRPAAAEKKIDIEMSLEGCSVPVSADTARLQQILNNILTNAVKFTPQGGRIEVTSSCTGPTVSVCVKDSGRGIDAAHLPHIFERYRQAEGASTQRHGGLGLGLAIARNLVELHGGSITAESDGSGMGSTFKFTLPAEVDDAVSAA